MGKNLQTWGKALGGLFATMKKGTSSIRLEVNKSKWEGLRNFQQILFDNCSFLDTVKNFLVAIFIGMI